MELPDWLLREESYEAPPDRAAWLSRSLLAVTASLASLRGQAARTPRAGWAAPLALVLVLLLILGVAAIPSGRFQLAVLAGELSLLAVQPPRVIARVLKLALAAAVFSALLVLPAALLGETRALLLLPARTFLTVTAVRLLTMVFSWHELIAGLGRLRVPRLVVALLDGTLRAMVLLGETAEEMLAALTLRSVGRDPHPMTSLGNLLGVLFLKSRRLAEETEQAMRCRGW